MALRDPLIPQPHLYLTDTSGRPLDGGKVYFGKPNKDPEFYPINVFYDDALTIAADQPVRTKNGFMTVGGNNIRVYASEDQYSIKVLDSYGRQVFYQALLDLSNADLEKVKFDTGITVTAKLGGVERSQHEKNADIINIRDFGEVTVGADITNALLLAIDYAHGIGGGVVEIPAGYYLVSAGITIKEGVILQGAGSGITIIDQQEGNFNLLSTPLVASQTLSAATAMPEGSMSYAVTNTCKAGDFIRIGCTDYWSLRWAETPIEDGGVIRKWYEAEMLEVESATSSVVKFKNPSFVNVSTSGLAAEFFTPSKSMGVKGMTLQKSEGVISGVATGLSVSQASNFYIDDVETKFYDYAGIDISKSANVYTQKTNHIGGDPSIGLCYGIVFNDGCRDVQAINVTGQKCRHVVAAGGGSGYAIPAYVSVSKLKASNSYNASFDAHGNSAYFNYSDMVVDKMGYAEGVGHTVSDIIAIADKDIGASFMVNGIGLDYSNILTKNHNQFVGANGVRDSSFRNVTIESDRFTNIAFRQTSSFNNTFDNLKISCPKASKASEVAIANACFTGTAMNGIASIASDRSRFNNTTLEGFPVVIVLGTNYVSFKGMRLNNCGWKGSVNIAFGMIQVSNAKSPLFDDVVVDNSNAALDFNGRFFMKIEPSKGSASKPKVLDKITLNNIQTTANSGNLQFLGKILTDDSVALAVLNNVYVYAASGDYTVFKPTNSNLVAQNIMPSDTYSKPA